MQFDRVIRAKILLTSSDYQGFRGEIDITNLRMTFNIQKSISNTPNSASVRIYNLGADNRNRLKGFGDQLRLFAGYREEEGAQLLFIGNITQFNHSFDQPEIITQLDCGDGDKNLNNILIPVSFGAKTPVRTVIEYVAERLQFPIAYFAPSPNEVYEFGFSDIYKASEILTTACQRLNLNWTLQNESLLILPTDQATTKPPAEINADTGMIGIPERYVDKKSFLYEARQPNEPYQPGWKVRVLLRPDLLPGDRVRIRSTRADINGEFRILTINHEGDNYGPIFQSTLEVYPT